MPKNLMTLHDRRKLNTHQMIVLKNKKVFSHSTFLLLRVLFFFVPQSPFQGIFLKFKKKKKQNRRIFIYF